MSRPTGAPWLKGSVAIPNRYVVQALIAAACLSALPGAAEAYYPKNYYINVSGTVQSGTDNGIFGTSGGDLAGSPYNAVFRFDSSIFPDFQTYGDVVMADIDANSSFYSSPDFAYLYSDFAGAFASASLTINGHAFTVDLSHPASDAGAVRREIGFHGPGNELLAYVQAGDGANFLSVLSHGDLFDSASLDENFVRQPTGSTAGFQFVQYAFYPEVGLIPDRSAFGSLGVSRVSWVGEFEFGAGTDPWMPLMPVDDPETPGFDIPVIVQDPTTTIFVDPIYAVGYDFSVDPNGPLFTSVVVPGALPGGDSVFELLAAGNSYVLNAGQVFDLSAIAAGGLSSFGIRGIDVSEAIDPVNPNGFVTGLTFSAAGAPVVMMTPVTFDTNAAVPEPATWAMLVCGFALMGASLRQRPRLRVAFVGASNGPAARQRHFAGSALGSCD